MSVSVDISWKSLNKHHEELCGDKVEVLSTEDSEIVILADGIGRRQGVIRQLIILCNSSYKTGCCLPIRKLLT